MKPSACLALAKPPSARSPVCLLALALGLLLGLPVAAVQMPAGAANKTATTVPHATAMLARQVLLQQREPALGIAPSDSLFPSQWWLQTLVPARAGAADFSSAWLRTTGNPSAGAGVVVAVLDSGITSHPEINARLLPGWDFVSNPVYSNDSDGRDNDPADPGDAIPEADRVSNPAAFSACPPALRSTWHGTVIAGQLAATSNNVEGVAAANWFTRVVPVRVGGQCGAAVGDIIDGMRWAAGLPVQGAPQNPNPARVIVVGYGGIDSCDTSSSDAAVAATARLYEAALAEVRQAGALVVAAAGNQRSSVGRPASCRGAFGVTALNREGFKAGYANFGAGLALATPGGDGGAGGTCDAELGDGGLLSTGNLGQTRPGAAGYVTASGTSFAAPAVAAAATLMLAVNPDLTVSQLEDGLRRSARPFTEVPALGQCSLAGNRGRCSCTTATCGAGMLDVPAALGFAAAPATWSAPVRAAFRLDDSRTQTCAALLGLAPAPADPPAPGPVTLPPVAPVAPPGGSTGADGGGGGGGAMSWPWLVALALGVLALRRER